jgi:hypothetical protein
MLLEQAATCIPITSNNASQKVPSQAIAILRFCSDSTRILNDASQGMLAGMQALPGCAKPAVVLSLLVGLATACAGRSPSAAARAALPVASSLPAASEPAALLPTYRFTGSTSPDDSRDALGSFQLMRTGDRLLVSASGSVGVSTMRTRQSLMGAIPVPARFGGGFLFWTGDAVYRSRTFLGPLEAVAPVPTNALGVAFGYDSLLISSEDNYRRQFRLDGTRIPLTPRGVLDTAASDDGRVIAIDAGGRALASVDRGSTWRDVSAELRGIVQLHGEASEVWFELADGTGAWLLPDGTLAKRPVPQPARAVFDRELAEREDWLERAVSDGVAVSAGRAAVAKGHQLALVDLVHRKLVGSARLVATTGFECEALSAAEEVLLACFDPKGGVAIVSHALGDAPRIEKRFGGAPRGAYAEGAPRVAYAEGNLLVATRCDGKLAEGFACVRKRDGSWHEHDLSARLAAVAPASPERFTLFVPEANGELLALVAHEAGNETLDHWALVGVGTQPIPLSQALPPIVRWANLSSYSANGVEHAFSKRVDTSFVVLRDGTLRGFARERSFSVTPQGKVVLGARVFEDLARRAGRALGREHGHQLWQSIDFGETWFPIAGPPYDEPGPFTAADCSEVGCHLGSWLRTGWPREPARRAPVFEAAPLVANEPSSVYPRLECSKRGPAQRIFARPSGDGENEFRDHSQGHSLIGMYGPVRAVLDSAARVASARPTKGSKGALSLALTEPFDPSLRQRAARIGAAPWSTAWQGKAAELPQDGGARPLLSTEPGHAAGVLFLDSNDELPFWVGSNSIIHPLPNWDGSREPPNGYVDARGKLWLLSSNCEGGVRVVDAQSGVVRLKLGRAYLHHDPRRAQSPLSRFLPPCPGFANPDAIAIGANGQLAVLRLPSGNDPATSDDPALVLAPGTDPIPLAPWSTLELGSSPACAASTGGYRALIQTPYAWLANEERAGNAPGMSALVRWSADRVCLEAVETPYENRLLVARFAGKEPGAVLVSGPPGGTDRQAVSCQLTHATAPP